MWLSWTCESKLESLGQWDLVQAFNISPNTSTAGPPLQKAVERPRKREIIRTFISAERGSGPD